MKTSTILLMSLVLAGATNTEANAQFTTFPFSVSAITDRPGPPTALRHSSYRGPTLSTALPTSGAYARGIQLPSIPTTGTLSKHRFGSAAPVPPNINYLQDPIRGSSFSTPTILGRSIARVAVHRAIYGNLGF